ncbi:uncharacterized protein LOC131632302 [Vicia villosa]|uniref:uncharacterized protein LOC131632302 n=1 Tax=Vicia villosa TaxID=3911 RepID=UPI00273B4AFE|nr:uncharacterized protein LOC131632302 [Vicia villosa]
MAISIVLVDFEGDPLSSLLFYLAEENVNCNKSFLYSSSMSVSRLNILAEMSGLKIGTSLFVYLGVPIFKGKSKAVHLHLIVDKITNRLSSWKCALLSFICCVELVKSVIQGMLTHSIALYSWPISLIWDVECAVKRFIWSGKTTKNKIIMVA